MRLSFSFAEAIEVFIRNRPKHLDIIVNNNYGSESLY